MVCDCSLLPAPLRMCVVVRVVRPFSVPGPPAASVSVTFFFCPRDCSLLEAVENKQTGIAGGLVAVVVGVRGTQQKTLAHTHDNDPALHYACRVQPNTSLQLLMGLLLEVGVLVVRLNLRLSQSNDNNTHSSS